MGMTPVSLTGQLICADDQEAQRVRRGLPDHLALTRAEPGCEQFDVVQTDDPLIWQVSERFVDVAAFARHQERASRSDWAVLTAGIRRNYTITGQP